MSGRGPFQDTPSIRVEALTLARGERVLIEGLSFSAGAGDYVELRGANGAGKTTLLRALAGFVRPRSGAIAIAGAEEPALALHYVGHLNGLKGAASVRAHAHYWRALFGRRGDSDAALAALGLSGQADLPARVLSQGQARRLALLRLLLAQRAIWLLDEPAAALDAQGRTLLGALMQKHRAAGGLIIAAVHEALDAAPTQTLTLGRAA